MTCLPRWAPLTLVVAAGACAAATSPLELTPWSPPRGQQCQAQPAEGTLAALVDSAALTDRLSTLGLPDGGLLLSVSVDSGQVIRFRRIETTWPADLAARVGEHVEDALEPGRAREARGRLLVRVAVDTLALELGAFETCPPAIENTDEVRERLTRLYERTGMLGGATLLLTIDSAGVVTDAEVRQSSGRPALDIGLVMVAHTARFHPALLDREPVPVGVSVPLSVRKPSRPRDSGG